MRKVYTGYILFPFFLLFFLQKGLCQSQDSYIKGYVFLEDGTAAMGATMIIDGSGPEAEKKYAITDKNGHFSISLPGNTTYQLQVSFIGKAIQVKTVYLPKGKDAEVRFVLEEDTQELSEVTVTGQTQNQKARNEIVKAEIVDTKKARAQSVTLVELMNRSAGIRVRQAGGLGSNTNIMLNGFQGKSIKIFKDGIPTDYLGAGYNISATPANMLERVEIYKGVLPTDLGADALGGAINMVSRMQNSRSVALSYEIGSFNTHRLSLNLKHPNAKNHTFWGVDAFYNYSDNDYTVTASVPDPETATVSPRRVKLFHNRYRHAYTEIYGGLTDLSWADELRLGITAFSIRRDNQFAALMEKPFGASFAQENAPVIPTLRYRKGFADQKFSMDQFLVYSKIKGQQTDTLRGSYDWYGNFHPPTDVNSRGESGRPTMAELTYSNLTSRTGLTYRINPHHTLALNIVFNDYNRKGKDPYGPTSIGENPVDLQSLPADYTKFVGTIGWKGQFADRRIENLFQLKYYGAKTKGQEVDAGTGYLNEKTNSARTSRFGLAEAVKLNLSNRTYFRLSVELATRLPEQTEILGNGSYILSNFNIKPERSTNGNLGFRTSPDDRWDIELNSFYRVTKDLIISVPVNLIFAQNVNVESVRGIGFEADVRFKPWSWLTLNGNSTYQDYRLFRIQAPLMQYLEGARLRNTPYFFSNIGASLQFEKVFSANDRVQAYYNMSYVHEFYLNYIPRNAEPDGFLGLWGEAKVDAPNIIPSQTVHSLGFLWKPKNTLPLTVNLECKNLFDKEVYDNFKIQNAGRSFHLKFNYILKY
ncbi:carboxypeptidase-like regulatory domain-containing protein [Sinomicrobium sp. M5D2P17]